MDTTYVHHSGAARLTREVLGLFKLRLGVGIMAMASFFALLLQLSVPLLAAGVDAALR